MIVFLALWFRLFLRARILEAARSQADQGLAGSMEGHAAMDMSIHAPGSAWRRLRSGEAVTSISHIFVMECAAVIRDVAIGLLVAGCAGGVGAVELLAALLLRSHPLLSKVWGPLIGPIVSLLSFVCSIGNVPLAAVLWNGGISFGGVVAFIFADLIIVPILVHLPEVLRDVDDALSLRQFLRHHGHRRVCRRAPLRRAGPRPERAGTPEWVRWRSASTTPPC